MIQQLLLDETTMVHGAPAHQACMPIHGKGLSVGSVYQHLGQHGLLTALPTCKPIRGMHASSSRTIAAVSESYQDHAISTPQANNSPVQFQAQSCCMFCTYSRAEGSQHTLHCLQLSVHSPFETHGHPGRRWILTDHTAGQSFFQLLWDASSGPVDSKVRTPVPMPDIFSLDHAGQNLSFAKGHRLSLMHLPGKACSLYTRCVLLSSMLR